MYEKLIILLTVIVLNLVNCDNGSRTKRLTTFPYNSCNGITVACAFPLVLPGRNVFYAFNFEANYNGPYPINQSSYIIPGPLAGPIDIVSTESPKARELKEDEGIVKRSLLTRKKTYSIVEKKLSSSGYKGRACLLRMICETAHIPINYHNGVLGDILHVILSPSTSMEEEKLHPEFYVAEKLGESGNCSKYQAKCELNFLDLASTIVHNLI